VWPQLITISCRSKPSASDTQIAFRIEARAAIRVNTDNDVLGSIQTYRLQFVGNRSVRRQCPGPTCIYRSPCALPAMPTRRAESKKPSREDWAFCLNLDGAGKRNRTPDLRITNALLYRLSYSGIRRNEIIGTSLRTWQAPAITFLFRDGSGSRGRLRSSSRGTPPHARAGFSAGCPEYASRRWSRRRPPARR
jgi:hypothetical protein